MEDEGASLWTVRAAWIFPIAGPPLKNGTVTVRGREIVAVEATPSRRVDQELPISALLPGLVNAHTHLEFSDLTQPLGQPGGRFADWIGEVIAYRASRGEERSFEAIRNGVAELDAAGVALAGEISTNDETFATPDPTILAFREILGLASERADELLGIARRFLSANRDPVRQRIAGLSPHSPYTLRFDLLERLVDLAVGYERPVAMHLAETGEELELLRSHSGPLVDFLSKRGFWRPDAVPRGIAILDYLRILERAPRSLVIHGTFLDEEEIAFLGQRSDRMSVVYCPRTHARLVGGKYPLEEFLAAGVRVALGTDSRASNPDLSLWNEVRFVRDRFPAIEPAKLLEMATIEGTRALGFDDRFGAIEPGRSSTLAAIDLQPDALSAAGNGPPWDALFANASSPRRFVAGDGQ